MFKKLFSHTAIYGLAPQITKVAGFLALPIITPYLTGTDFGVYGLVIAVVAAIEVFSSLGLNIVLGNMFLKSPARYQIGWRQVYGFLLIWNILYAFLLSGILYLAVKFTLDSSVLENIVPIILANVIPVVLFGPAQLLGSTFYRYNQMPMQIAKRTAVAGILTVALNIVFIAYWQMGYMGWFISLGIARLLLQLSFWYPLNFKYGIKPIFNFKWRFIKSKLRVSIPTVPHFYGGYLMNSADRLVMGFLGVPTHNLGLYQAANTVSGSFQSLGTASAQAVGPLMMEGYKKKDEHVVRRLTFVLQTVFLLGAFLVSLWLKEIFSFLFKNKELAANYHLGIILVMAYCYRPMYFGANNRLFYYERTHSLPRITLVAGLLTTGLNIVFIPIWGYEVAAYTTFIGLMYMGFSGYYLKDHKELASLSYYPLYWLFAIITATATVYFLVDYNFVVKMVISIIVILMFFIAYKKMKNK